MQLTATHCRYDYSLSAHPKTNHLSLKSRVYFSHTSDSAAGMCCVGLETKDFKYLKIIIARNKR